MRLSARLVCWRSGDDGDNARPQLTGRSRITGRSSFLMAVRFLYYQRSPNAEFEGI